MPQFVQDVINQPQGSFSTGSNLDVDGSAEQLIAVSHPATTAVLVRADAENSGVVYLGDSASVTAGTLGSTDGLPLSAGDAISIPVTNANLIYAIGSAANQKLFFLAI